MMGPSTSLYLLLVLLLVSHVEGLGTASAGGLLEAYRGLLAVHPLRTNMITASVLTVASDAIAQSMERRGKAASAVVAPPPPHDYQRSLSMSIYGAAVFGAFVTQWFKLLSWMCPVSPGDWGSILRKVGVNQFFMSPFLNMLFFSWVTFTRGNPFSTSFPTKMDSLRRKLSQDLVPTILRSCVYWTVFNCFNFGVVSQQYQVVATNVGFVTWTVYLSFIGYRAVLVK